MKVQELFEGKEEGFYVLNGRPGEWEFIAGPFDTKEQAEAARSKHKHVGEDYAIRKLKKKPSEAKGTKK